MDRAVGARQDERAARGAFDPQAEVTADLDVFCVAGVRNEGDSRMDVRRPPLTEQEPFVLGVVGDDPFGDVLEATVEQETVRVGWGDIYGARQLGGTPGYVQLRVLDHLPMSDPRKDPFTVPVASEADANRLLTSIRWRTVPVATERRRRLRR